MPPSTGTCRFGPFRFDLGRRHLWRGEEQVSLPDRSLAALAVLLARPGDIISLDDLTNAVWTDFNVSDNSIVKAFSILRKGLGRQPSGKPYIETLVRRGYRFVATVEYEGENGHDPHTNGHRGQAVLNPLDIIEPHAAFTDGRALVETLDLSAIDRAREAFAAALSLNPNHEAAHIGMANVCLFRYESTRSDIEPDRAALAQAGRHALEACRLNPKNGHAWSAFALVRHGQGQSRLAIAAAREAIACRKEEWRHHLRLAHVSWGSERLEAAYTVLDSCPDLAFAHWFAATVYIARGAREKPMEHLVLGCAAQDLQRQGKDGQRKAGGPFAAVGLHWLHALVLASHGNVEAAREELLREQETAQPGLIYARECAGNTSYALGVLALRRGCQDEARARFQEALAQLPAHPLATLALGALGQLAPVGQRAKGRGQRAGTASSVALSPDTVLTAMPLALPPSHGDAVQVAIVRAAVMALQGQHSEAAAVCANALVSAPPGSAGWLLPVEPLIHASAHPDAWTHALSVLRDRAV